VDATLQEIELTSRKVNVAPAIDQAREAFMSFADSVGSSLGNAISQGGFEGMTTLRDIVKNTLRGILADILSSGIRKGLMALFDVFTGGGKGGAGGGGIMSFLTKAISSVFLPGKAGGGNVTGLKPFMVGEEGPELFMPSGSGRIVSTPALAGMGGGTVNYSPQTNITVTGNALDDKTKEELLAYIELGRARDQRQLSRIVTQNGLKGAR
jgi:phage-related minor tail protein